MRTIRSFVLCGAVATATVFSLVTAPVSACGEPTKPPPKTFIDIANNKIYVELGAIFPTFVPHGCSCGVGLGSATQPLPPNFFPLGIQIVIIDKGTTPPTVTPISAFNTLQLNGPATNGWQNGAGQPGFGQPVPGSTWFGFGGVVQPIPEPPVPNPNQWLAICLELGVEGGQGSVADLAGIPVQIGAGLANPNNPFAPLFVPGAEHAATYGGVSPLGGASVVPTVGEWGLIVLSLLLLTAGTLVIRRESAKVPAFA